MEIENQSERTVKENFEYLNIPSFLSCYQKFKCKEKIIFDKNINRSLHLCTVAMRVYTPLITLDQNLSQKLDKQYSTNEWVPKKTQIFINFYRASKNVRSQ